MKRAASIRSASAIPTDIEIPWPSGPVVASIPGLYLRSGWPAVGQPTWRKCSMSSSVIGYPVRYSIEYSSIDACPAERMKRSRLIQSGFAGLWRITRV